MSDGEHVIWLVLDFAFTFVSRWRNASGLPHTVEKCHRSMEALLAAKTLLIENSTFCKSRDLPNSGRAEGHHHEDGEWTTPSLRCLLGLTNTSEDMLCLIGPRDEIASKAANVLVRTSSNSEEADRVIEKLGICANSHLLASKARSEVIPGHFLV